MFKALATLAFVLFCSTGAYAATTACDNGSPAGVPLVASVAGFSRCVLNADFTVAGGPFSNVAEFIDGCGAAPPLAFQAFYAYSGAQVPCNRMAVETNNGVQEFHIQYQHGDSTPLTGGVVRPLELAYPTLHHNGAVQSGWPQPAGAGTANLPQEMYAEIIFRTTQASLNQGQPGKDIPFAWWQEGGAGEPAGPNIEIDWTEINSDSDGVGGTIWHNTAGMREWGGTAWSAPTISTWIDYRQYHKLGVLVTSDLVTNFTKCLFVDGTLAGCSQITPTVASAFRTDRTKFFNYLAVWAGNNGVESVNPVDIYITHLGIWECPTYATTNCAGTKFNSAPEHLVINGVPTTLDFEWWAN